MRRKASAGSSDVSQWQDRQPSDHSWFDLQITNTILFFALVFSVQTLREIDIHQHRFKLPSPGSTRGGALLSALPILWEISQSGAGDSCQRDWGCPRGSQDPSGAGGCVSLLHGPLHAPRRHFASAGSLTSPQRRE